MNKSLNVSVMAGLALALASTGALAQGGGAKKKPAPAPVTTTPAPSPSGSIGQGDTELGFFGNYHDDGDISTLLLGASVGSYLKDDLLMRVTGVVGLADAAGTTSVFFIPNVTAEFQFGRPGSPWVPYAGGGAGMIIFGNDDIFLYNLFLTPTAGVKYFLNERTSVEYAFAYQFPLIGESCDDIDCYDAEVSILSNTLRINIYY